MAPSCAAAAATKQGGCVHVCKGGPGKEHVFRGAFTNGLRIAKRLQAWVE